MVKSLGKPKLWGARWPGPAIIDIDHHRLRGRLGRVNPSHQLFLGNTGSIPQRDSNPVFSSRSRFRRNFRPDVYKKAAATDAWRHTLACFRQHLK